MPRVKLSPAPTAKRGEGLGSPLEYAAREPDHREWSSPSLAACKSASMVVDALIPV
jgi:hypothetical protein